MFTLAIDTSTSTAGCALMEDERVRAEIILNLGVNHSASLLPSIDHLIKLAGIRMADIDLYACTVGPGSFTGLRIGASTVKGFAMATGKPIAGVSALEALALNVAQASMLICPMLDAKKRQIYTALYRLTDAFGIEGIDREQAIEVEKFLPHIHEDCVFVGDGALVYQDIIKSSLQGRAFFALPIHHSIRAAAVGLLGIGKYRANDVLNAFTITPQYLRTSEAELKIAKKARS